MKRMHFCLPLRDKRNMQRYPFELVRFWFGIFSAMIALKIMAGGPWEEKKKKRRSPSCRSTNSCFALQRAHDPWVVGTAFWLNSVHSVTRRSRSHQRLQRNFLGSRPHISVGDESYALSPSPSRHTFHAAVPFWTRSILIWHFLRHDRFKKDGRPALGKRKKKKRRSSTRRPTNSCFAFQRAHHPSVVGTTFWLDSVHSVKRRSPYHQRLLVSHRSVSEKLHTHKEEPALKPAGRGAFGNPLARGSAGEICSPDFSITFECSSKKLKPINGGKYVYMNNKKKHRGFCSQRTKMPVLSRPNSQKKNNNINFMFSTVLAPNLLLFWHCKKSLAFI